MKKAVLVVLLVLLSSVPAGALLRPSPGIYFMYPRWDGTFLGFSSESNNTLDDFSSSCARRGGFFSPAPVQGNFICLRGPTIYGVHLDDEKEVKSMYLVQRTDRDLHSNVVASITKDIGTQPTVVSRESGLVGWNLTGPDGEVWGLAVKHVRSTFSVAELRRTLVHPRTRMQVISDGP